MYTTKFILEKSKLKMIKRMFIKFIAYRRLEKLKKIVHSICKETFLFARESKRSGYDIEWVTQQFYKSISDNELVKEIVFQAVYFAYHTEMSYDDFNKMIWEELTNINKKTLANL